MCIIVWKGFFWTDGKEVFERGIEVDFREVVETLAPAWVLGSVFKGGWLYGEGKGGKTASVFQSVRWGRIRALLCGPDHQDQNLMILWYITVSNTIWPLLLSSNFETQSKSYTEKPSYSKLGCGT